MEIAIIIASVAAVIIGAVIAIVVLRGRKKKADAVATDIPQTPEKQEEPAPTGTEASPIEEKTEAAANESKTEIADKDEPEAETDVDEEVTQVIIDGNGQTRLIVVKYSKSFLAKLIQSDERTKRYYSELKNKLLLYGGVKSKVSWKYETFRKGRKTLAKLRLRGKTLSVCLAIDPDDYMGSEYRVESLAEIKSYANTPCLYRIKSNRRLAYSKELIEELAIENDLIETTDLVNTDYVTLYPYEDNDALIKRGLIKVLSDKNKRPAPKFEPTEEEKVVEEVEHPIQQGIIDKAEPTEEQEVVEQVEQPVEQEIVEEIVQTEEEDVEEMESTEEQEVVEEDEQPDEQEVVDEPDRPDEEEVVEEDEQPDEQEEVAGLEPSEVLESVSAQEVDSLMKDEVAVSFIVKAAGKTDKTKQGIINIDTLSKCFNSGETVTLAEIKKRVKGFNKKTTYLKVLARGTLDKPLTVEADSFSIQAVKMIVLTGGKVIKKYI